MKAHGRIRISTSLLICWIGWFGLPGCSRPNEAKNSIVSPSKDAVAGSKDESARVINDPSFVPFDQAVRLDAPDGENRPPDMTVNGKVTGKLFEQIAGKDGKGGLWDQVHFVTAQGKPLKSFALVKTDAGDMKIELFHQAAANHVRSFICLARAGYFDGLPFHQSIRRDDFRYLESGCPKGAGELGYGSIGYWLKPEISKTLTHEEGAVGAWHPEELERAACRFYVTLGKTPAYDGNYTIFGKVVHGLDVAHTINKRPVQDEEYQGPPQEPYRIRQVLIEQIE
jgi:cyclophilin family peptidyl-prolyl cis-trans isomerase